MQKTIRYCSLPIIVLISFFYFIANANAANFYVCQNATECNGGDGSGWSTGNNANTCTDKSTPCTTIQEGVSQMTGGDTLIIGDGTYDEPLPTTPNGTDGNYTVIKSDNDGGVIIAGSYPLDNALGSARSYIQIEGMKFNHPSTKRVYGHHIKLLRCAFEGGASGGNVGVFAILSGAHDILVEDCWSYGLGGRFNVLTYDASDIIFRRLVVRNDGGWTSNNSDPEAGLNVYQSANVEVQNCIVIDSDLETYDNDDVGAFYYTGHLGNRSSDNVRFIGDIALNINRGGWNMDTDDLGENIKLVDVISYDTAWGAGIGNTQNNTSIQRATFGNLDGRAIFDYSAVGHLTVANSVFFRDGDLNNGLQFASPTVSTDDVFYCDIYNYTGDSTWNTFAGNGMSHTNPQDNGLQYLVRVEDGSNLQTAGQDGGQMGANITNRVGVSGTLYGEPGFDTVTSEPLWPWPNEDRIKEDFATVSTRGFAGYTSPFGSPDTLTSYIWEYLGNEIPCDIYGTCDNNDTIDGSDDAGNDSGDNSANSDDGSSSSCFIDSILNDEGAL